MTRATAKQIIDFWVNDVGPKGWYEADTAVDRQIIERFGTAYDAAVAGDLNDWRDTSQGSLALLLLLDQFSRNMFRGDPRSFAADPLARDIARGAIAMDLDLEIKGGEQQFFYLPFAHSEDMADQDFGVECVQTRKFQNDDDALHARAHREIIRTFGRFPFRNQVLNRDSSDAEQEFMFDGGYGNIVRKLQAP
tara:strand:- start:94120 stop:94698 length:579 start_codon:yes stop_codon:yes gene_type:complete